MKKIIVILIVVMFCLSLAGLASAETTIGKNGCTMVSTIFGGGTYAPSTGVTVNIKSIPTAYCAASQHQSSNDTNGGLQFHTLSSDPAMPPTTATPAANGKPTPCASETAI
jgi:hypothetical protein